MLMRILFFMFVLLPLLELYVLIQVGSDIGGLTTIALCLLTAAMGGLIIRWQGLQTLLQARKSMQQAQQHQLAEHGLHGVMLVLAGAMLFVPGFLTDSLGFLLLIPAFRRRLMRGFTLGMVGGQASSSSHASQGNAQPQGRVHVRYDEVIDVQVIDKK